MRKIAVALITSAVLAGAAQAAPVTPETYKMQTFNDVVTVCGAADESSAQFCRGWLIGNGSLYLKLLDTGVIKRKWACADPIPNLDDIRRAVVAYGESNPQLGKQGAIDGFWQAAASIWPCK